MKQHVQLLSYLSNLKNVTSFGYSPQSEKLEDYTQKKFIPDKVVSKKKVYRKEFDIYKIESLVNSKLSELFLSGVDINNISSCSRQLYYRNKQFPTILKDSKILSVRFYVGNELREFINSIYNINRNIIEIKNEYYSKKISVIIESDIESKEIKNIDYTDFYNKGCICAYILNSNYSYKISDVEIIYIFRKNEDKIITYSKKYSENIFKNFLKNFEEFKKEIQEEKIPKTEISKNQCESCLYETYCKKDSLKNILIEDKKPVFKF